MNMWQIKCIKDSVKAVLPFQRQMRKIKDSLFGYQRVPNRDRDAIRDGLHLIELCGKVDGAKVLEVGTGWQPLIPIVFSLAGADVFLTDLYPLMRPETFRAALDGIRENKSEIATRLSIDIEKIEIAARPCSDQDMAERLRELRLEYLAPCDCQRLPLNAATIDIVVSRAVLEHVPPSVIEGIFRESRRILRTDGVMAHIVDHSDHWSHRDRRINAVNFLRYPDWLFRLTCINPQNYQNRLRHSQYRIMLEAAGFSLKSENCTINEECLISLSSMPLASKFHRFDPNDLATVDSLLVGQVR